MNPAFYSIFLVLFLFSTQRRSRKKGMQKILLNRNAEGKTAMLELAKRFIGEYCLIYTYDTQMEGTLKEVTEGGILLERKDGSLEIVNPGFLVRIRQYPKDKNGKRKSVVVD